MISDLVWIVGPCSMENEELYLETAGKLCELMEGREWYYKSSFDKANRTAIQGRRGPGLEEGLRFLQLARDKFPGIRLTTDVHETYQVRQLEGLVEVIQIPAFLCRQTDLLIECGKYFDIIHIKKGSGSAQRRPSILRARFVVRIPMLKSGSAREACIMDMRNWWLTLVLWKRCVTMETV